MDPRIPHAARLQQQQKHAEAEQIYRQVIATQPKNGHALLLLGLLLHETGRHELALQTLLRAKNTEPHWAEIHQTLVGPLVALNRLPEAIAASKEAVRLRPLAGEMHDATAQLMLKASDFAGALPYARRAIELRPNFCPGFITLSRVYQGLENIPESMAAIDRALAVDPNFGDALVEKGYLLQMLGQIDEAISVFEAGLKILPKNVAALNNLGSCYLMKTRMGDAIRCFEAAAEIWPNSAKPRNNVGAALKERGQIDEAIVQFKKAIRIDPTNLDSYCNLGGCYDNLGDHDQAIAVYREALKIQPDFAAVGSNLLMSFLAPVHFSPQEVFDQHVAWNRDQAARFSSEILPFTNDFEPGRRLKVAYVSPDFREHSVRYFIEPVLANHDRSKFEVFCYAAGRRRDEVTDRLATRADQFIGVAGISDRKMADLIRSHGIDILVDLAGHTSDNRLLTFARKPAPVQVTYLGYPTTTGLITIDYRLTDAVCDPPGADAFYTEKLIRLPNAFFVYNDDPNRPFDPVLPADRAGVFTFGSFNNYTKFDDHVLDSWAGILRSVTNSRLVIKTRPLENASTQEKVRKFFVDRGIAADRVDLLAWMSLQDHLTLLGSRVDLQLDTFPYNGHTTTCQSIWAGVPVVTLSGDTFRSRVGECTMRNLKLPEFVARSKQEYESIAVSLATNWGKLRELRPTLRQRMIDSPLCDARGFTRSLENAYQQMWSALPLTHA